MRRLPLWLLLIFFLGQLPAPLLAQVSVNVNNLDPVYRDIYQLRGHGLIKKIVMGQRPWSRQEFARMTGEAMHYLSLLEANLEDPEFPEKKKASIRRRLPIIRRILRRLQQRFQEELIQLGFLEGKSRWYSAHPLEQAQFDILVDNSLPRMIPSNGIGEIDAIINPLLQYRQGRRLVDGSNISLETVTWVRASNHFAALVRPRFQLAFGRDGQADDNNVFVHNLYGKFYIKNFEVEVGRDQVFYGQGYNAGLLLSNNPRGLDMVKISNDNPGFLPGFLRYIGAHKLSFFYADLGPEQHFPNSYLVGWKWSVQGTSFFEIGLSSLVLSGGEGSPPGSFGERVWEIFPFIAVVGDVPQIGNKMFAVDWRFRIPPARGLEVYSEMAFDDINANARTQFIDDAAYIFGFYLPRLLDTGQVDLRMEYHQTGIRFYRHGQFLSGNTENQFILGDNLGPDGKGFYLVVNWEVNPENLITFENAFEDRSNDIYVSQGGPGTDQPSMTFTKVQDLPNERRYRSVVSWQNRIKKIPMLMTVRFGAERVQNFNFVGGNDRTNFMGEILLQIFFDRQTRFPRSFQ